MPRMPSDAERKSQDIQDDPQDNLSISLEWDEDFDKDSYPCILFTPNMGNTNEHYHIRLSDDAAMRLHAWLEDFLISRGRLEGHAPGPGDHPT